MHAVHELPKSTQCSRWKQQEANARKGFARKAVSFLLSVILAMCLLPSSAFAEEHSQEPLHESYSKLAETEQRLLGAEQDLELELETAEETAQEPALEPSSTGSIGKIRELSKTVHSHLN